VNQKLSVVQENNIRSRDQVKTKVIELMEAIQKVELKEKELDYKLTAAFKQIEVNSGMINALASPGNTRPTSQGSIAIETQLSFLRDQIVDEQKKREALQIETNRMSQSFADQMR
jgi:hypothetical protein